MTTPHLSQSTVPLALDLLESSSATFTETESSISTFLDSKDSEALNEETLMRLKILVKNISWLKEIAQVEEDSNVSKQGKQRKRILMMDVDEAPAKVNQANKSHKSRESESTESSRDRKDSTPMNVEITAINETQPAKKPKKEKKKSANKSSKTKND